MKYKKEFKISETNGLILMNPNKMIEYIQCKVDELLEIKDPKLLLEKKIEIINEFYEIVRYDKKHSIFPIFNMSILNDKQRKEYIDKKIFISDLVYYLGNIFSNYHMYSIEDIPIIGNNAIGIGIHYDDLYYYAINEYYIILLNHEIPNVINKRELYHVYKHKKYHDIIDYRGIPLDILRDIPEEVEMPIIDRSAYAATFITPTLIERFLLSEITLKIIRDGLSKIDKKMLKTETEKTLYDIFMKKGTKIFDRDVKPDLYEILKRNNLLEEDSARFLLGKDEEGKSITLGDIFHSKYCYKIIKKQYYKLLYDLFVTLNLRNNIMHGNDDSMNYYAIGLTSIMIEILLTIIRGEIFNEQVVSQ